MNIPYPILKNSTSKDDLSIMYKVTQKRVDSKQIKYFHRTSYPMLNNYTMARITSKEQPMQLNEKN